MVYHSAQFWEPCFSQCISQHLAEGQQSSQISNTISADDTQVYVATTPENVSSAIPEPQKCHRPVKDLMAASKLKLKPDKTE